MGLFGTMNSVFRLAAFVAAGFLAQPGLAAAAKKAKSPAPNPITDLTVAPLRYSVKCPLPKQAQCVIRKPVDTGYRILTNGLDMEDRGDYWIADFSKADAAKSKLSIRVLGRNNDLHDIEVLFQAGSSVSPADSKK